jgi:hypothetical protein
MPQSSRKRDANFGVKWPVVRIQVEFEDGARYSFLDENEFDGGSYRYDFKGEYAMEIRAGDPFGVGERLAQGHDHFLSGLFVVHGEITQTMVRLAHLSEWEGR